MSEDVDLLMTQTYRCLLEAFEQEAAWLLRLDYFARRAEYEGHSEIVRVLKLVRDASRIAAEGHLDFLRDVERWSGAAPAADATTQLEATVARQHDKVGHRYPSYARTAHSEGLPDVASWFESLARSNSDLLDELRGATGSRPSSGPAPALRLERM